MRKLFTVEERQKRRNYVCINDYINEMKVRPAVYLDKESIFLLQAYLNGMNVMNALVLEAKNFTITLSWLNEFIRTKYRWENSVAGWKNIILQEKNNCEKEALFTAFDDLQFIFSTSIEKVIFGKPIVKPQKTSNGLLVAPGYVEVDIEGNIKGVPIFTNAESYYILQLSNKLGYILYLNCDVPAHDKEKEHYTETGAIQVLFPTIEECRREIINYFGNVKCDEKIIGEKYFTL